MILDSLTLPGQRFLGIAPLPFVGVPSATVAVIRENPSTMVSTVVGYNASLAQFISRDYSWSTSGRLGLIAGEVVTQRLAVSRATTTSLIIEELDLGLVTTAMTSVKDRMAFPMVTMRRLRPLSDGSSPRFIAVLDEVNTTRGELVRIAPAFSTLAFLGVTQPIRADDVIQAPVVGSAPDRLLFLGRCGSGCNLAGVSASADDAPQRFGLVSYRPTLPGFDTPTLLNTISRNGAPIFTGPVSGVSDGNTRLYLLGNDASGALLIETWTASASPNPVASASTTQPFILADAMRSPVGDAVLLLGRVGASGMLNTPAGAVPITSNTANLGNVVVVRLNTTQLPLVITYDVAGDQTPTGFARGADGSLYIIGTQGVNDGFLWRVALPP
jgi:hypothetical protein